MLALANSYMGEDICRLSSDGMTEDKYWTYESGNYYVTLSNGDKTELEIFDRSIEPSDYIVEEILARVIHDDEKCAPFANTIRTQIMSFGARELPKMTDGDIVDFIDHELTPLLACKAAETVAEGIDDEGMAYELSANYLEDQGILQSVQVMCGIQSVIEDVREGVNKAEGREVFDNGDYVWAYTYEWHEGEIFSYLSDTRLFKSQERAYAEMENDAEEVFQRFNEYYHSDNIAREQSGSWIRIHEETNEDVWHGKVTRKRLED